MRENPDTSLKLLQMLANEPDYPSRLTIRHFADELGVDGDVAELHLRCCVDHGLVEVRGRTTVVGLTGRGQDFVRNAEAAGFWERAKEYCRDVGIGATTSTLGQAMSSLAQGAVRSIVDSGG